ncbi:MAG: 30S ribosomal protein S6 [Candidatus Margulisbacteria bacterium]|nr:30S ribosomal protein S6 [Candidatus Margulisiibacteriota bacterium]
MKYEAIILIKPELSDEKIDELLKKYEKFINENNGQFVGAEKWGEREVMVKFAKFKKLLDAYYVLINFVDDKHNIEKLNYAMKIDDSIIRHMISRVVEVKTEEVKAA